MIPFQQAEKLKSHKMNEGWMKNDKVWKIMISGNSNSGTFTVSVQNRVFLNLEPGYSVRKKKYYASLKVQY